MSNKDYEFITKEEWNIGCREFYGLSYHCMANKLLHDKCQMGYVCRGSVADTTNTTDILVDFSMREADTHKAFVFLQPIKLEAVEDCDHIFKFTVGDIIDHKTIGRWIAGEVDCPKCGKDLK